MSGESDHKCYIKNFRDFFEDKIGPCSFDFTKVSQDRGRLFVAVRFETRDDAKECMSRLDRGSKLNIPAVGQENS